MRLVGLDATQIRTLASGHAVEVDGVPLEWPADDRRVLRYRVAALDADPGSAPYLLHVLLDGDVPAGRIGCHEGPRDGVLEIGYYVAEPFRGRGVATSMVRQFLAWLGARGVRRVRTGPGRAPRGPGSSCWASSRSRWRTRRRPGPSRSAGSTTR